MFNPPARFAASLALLVTFAPMMADDAPARFVTPAVACAPAEPKAEAAPGKAAEIKAKMKLLDKELAALVSKKDYDGAMKKLDEMARVDPDRADHFQLRKLSLLINSKYDYVEGNAFAAKLMEGDFKEKGEMLGFLAIMISRPVTTSQPVKGKRDFALAVKAAERGVELRKAETPMAQAVSLGTLAMVQFEMGEIDKAIETQTKAVEMVPEDRPDGKQSYRAGLEKYKAAKKK